MPVSRSEIEVKVNNLLLTDFEIPQAELRPEGKLFEDYELDSLDAIDILLSLENIFSIKLTDEQRNQAKKIRVVRDIYDFVEEVLRTS